jgi:catalase (peroxidase I)
MRRPRRRNRRADDVAHRKVVNRDVFEERAIDRFERQALAAFEHAIGNRDVAEASVRFRAELDAAGLRHAGLGRELLIRAVEQGAFFPASAYVSW